MQVEIELQLEQGCIQFAHVLLLTYIPNPQSKHEVELPIEIHERQLGMMVLQVLQVSSIGSKYKRVKLLHTHDPAGIVDINGSIQEPQKELFEQLTQPVGQGSHVPPGKSK